MKVPKRKNAEQDMAAILRLMKSYCDTIDDGDFEACSELFREGAWGIEGALVKGSEAVFGELQNVTLYDGRPLTRHLMSNVHVEIATGEATATASSCLTVMQAVPPNFPLQAIFIGSYADYFEKHDGLWRFVERRIKPDLIGDMSRHRADMAKA